MKSPAIAAATTSIHSWIINHDDSRAFIVAYIGLAVILSAFVSLFWLVVVVAIHFFFEYIRQRHVGGTTDVPVLQALWELRLDLALIVFAMVITLYMEFVIGVAGLRLAPRLGRAITAGSRGTARFAAWSRILRAALLSLDDLGQVIRVAIMRRAKKSAPPAPEMAIEPIAENSAPVQDEQAMSCRNGWSVGDWLIAIFFALSFALLLLTPVLTDHTLASAVATIRSEMHPLP